MGQRALSLPMDLREHNVLPKISRGSKKPPQHMQGQAPSNGSGATQQLLAWALLWWYLLQWS